MAYLQLNLVNNTCNLLVIHKIQLYLDTVKSLIRVNQAVFFSANTD